MPFSHLPFISEDMLADCLRRTLGLDRDAQIDAVTEAAARLTGCPIAYVSLVWRDRLWLKSESGMTLGELPLDGSICRLTVAQDAPLIVADARADPRLAALPPVTCAPGIRAYAGIPLRVPCGRDGEAVAIGAFCAVDHVPRVLTTEEVETLHRLAGVVEALIVARLAAVTAVDNARALTVALEKESRLHRQFRQAERMANVGSWRLTLEDHRVEWSEQIYHIHEVPVGHSEGLADALSFYPPAHRLVIEQAVERAIGTGQGYDVEVDFVTAKGRPRRVRAIGEVELRDGVPVALIGVFQDITARYRLEQALEHRANTDELTRIASRGRFNAVLDAAVAARPVDEPLALVLVDLDHFKEANDRCGHPAGDEVLRRVAAGLQAEWLGGSLAARLGGDEFALVLTDPALVADLPGTLARLLGELEMAAEGGDARVAVSATLGACRFGADAVDRAAMLAQADAALYAAKRWRRGSAAIAGDDTRIVAAVSPTRRAA